MALHLEWHCPGEDYWFRGMCKSWSDGKEDMIFTCRAGREPLSPFPSPPPPPNPAPALLSLGELTTFSPSSQYNVPACCRVNFFKSGSDSVALGWGLGFCVYDKDPGDAVAAAGPRVRL